MPGLLPGKDKFTPKEGGANVTFINKYVFMYKYIDLYLLVTACWTDIRMNCICKVVVFSLIVCNEWLVVHPSPKGLGSELMTGTLWSTQLEKKKWVLLMLL